MSEPIEIEDGPPLIPGIDFTLGRSEPIDLRLAFNTLTDEEFEAAFDPPKGGTVTGGVPLIPQGDLMRLFDAAADTVSRLIRESTDKSGTVDWTRFNTRMAETVESLQLAVQQLSPGSVN